MTIFARQHTFSAAGPARGVTLIELMVGVAVLAVVLTIGLPSFQDQLAGWRRDSAVQAFTNHVQIARTTALRTSRPVVMCTSGDGQSCDNTASTGDWRQTWLVFVDTNSNSDLDAGERLVAVRAPQSGLDQMSGNAARGRLAFRPSGLLASGSTTITVVASSATDNVAPIAIRVNAVGRVSVGMP